LLKKINHIEEATSMDILQQKEGVDDVVGKGCGVVSVI